MCIAILSTSHPSYSLILINNRDEFLHRPTASADWWSHPHSHVLGARDLYRPRHGTWLGVTKQGRVAVLTNYAEQGPAEGVVSRGAMVNAFLEQSPGSDVGTEEFVGNLLDGDGIRGAGGFSLVCGRMGERLAVVSNRTKATDKAGVAWVAADRGSTDVLSNTEFGDRSWPKVVAGQDLMERAVEASVEYGETEDELIERLLQVLCTDTLPKKSDGEGFQGLIGRLKQSVFIPPIEVPEQRSADLAVSDIHEKMEPHPSDALHGIYGTMIQTVILFDTSGRVKFFERTLFDEDAQPIARGQGDRAFVFQI